MSIRSFARLLLGLGLALLAQALLAAPWAVVANHLDRTIQTIDLGTAPATVHGPFFSGQMGSVGALTDVALTPDLRYALVTNYYACTVTRVDLADPANPVLAGTLTLPFITGAGFPFCFTPLDIAIAPNGQYAIVTDGRTPTPPPNPPTTMLGFIDLATFTYSGTYTLTTNAVTTAGGLAQGTAQAVAIGADSETVIVADRAGHRIIYGQVNATRDGLVSEGALSTGVNSFPINVTIAPDGQTVLVSTALTVVPVFQITAPGVVVAGTTPTVAGLPGRQQSIVFSPNGQRAYALSTTPAPHQISWLQVNGPGDVSLGGAGVATLLSEGNSDRVMGVDVLGITPDGGRLVVGNPSLPASGPTTVNNNSVTLVDTALFSTTTQAMGNYPMGLAVFLAGLPTLTTAAVSGVGPDAATGGGEITSDGGAPVTARGVCWSTALDPTTADTCTSDGTGSGAFASAIAGLLPNTSYHVRAYATNSAGTAYGQDRAFVSAVAPTEIPALGDPALLLMASLIAGLAASSLRRRRQ